MYDLIIIGGGPAGAAAAVYAARKRIKSLIIAEDWGGQSVVSPDVQNWIGTVSISGTDIAKSLREHVLAYADDVLEVADGERAKTVAKNGAGFSVETESGNKYDARALLICSGSRRKKLEVPGAAEFDNKGISYCASCDAPLFRGKDVVVIGGGNAGFEAAQQLLSYANSVTLFERTESFKADPVTVESVMNPPVGGPKMKALTNVEAVEIKGDTLVSGIVYKNNESGKTEELAVGGIFVEIGAVPNSEFVKDLVKLNKFGEIVTDCRTQRTSRDGVWAAGDVSDVLYKQNNISMGDAVKALEDIYIWLNKNKI